MHRPGESVDYREDSGVNVKRGESTKDVQGDPGPPHVGYREELQESRGRSIGVFFACAGRTGFNEGSHMIHHPG